MDDQLVLLTQEDDMKEMQDGRARIKVVGCGGGGNNAVNRMISAALKGVQFVAVNTDVQALERCHADVKVNIGRKLTRGLGSGGDWTKGRDAADENRTELSEIVRDSDMVFITAGMGGGTGTGSAPVVAGAAKQAVSSPLLETSIDGARGILFNITAGKDITLHEIKKAAEIVKASADPSANIIFGVCNDDRMQDEVKITVIATGFGTRLTSSAGIETERQQEARPAEMPRPDLGGE